MTVLNIIVLLLVLIAIGFTIKTIVINKDLSSNRLTIGILFSTSIALLISQLIFSSYAPEEWKKPFSTVLNVIPIILSIILCQIYWHKLQQDIENKIFDSIYPTLMVAQGTFYTFVGVSAILLSYKSTGSSSGATMLIGGLKLAFLTSVVGILYSIAAKVYIKEKMDASKTHFAKPVYHDEEDFYALFVNMSKTLTDIKEQSTETEQRVQTIINKTNEENRKLSRDTMNALIEKSEQALESVTNEMIFILKGSCGTVLNQIDVINEKLNTTASSIDTLNHRITSSCDCIKNLDTVSENYYKQLTSNRQIILTQYQDNIALLAKILEQLTKYNELMQGIDYNSFRKFEENIYSFSSAIAKYKQIVEYNLDNMNSILQNNILNSDEILSSGAKEINQQINLLISSLELSNDNAGKIIYNELTKLQANYRILEDKLHNVDKQATNFVGKTNLIQDVLITFNKQLPNYMEQLQAQIENLEKNQINHNDDINAKLIKSQEQYIDKLNKLLDKSVNIASETVQKPKEELTPSQNDLQTKTKTENIVNTRND